MMTVRFVVAVAAVSVTLTIACGGGQPHDELVGKLSGLLPDAGHIRTVFADYAYEPETVPEVTGEWGNEDVAHERSVPESDIIDSGRIDGYRVTYHMGPAVMGSDWLSSVTATVSLYSTESSAQDALALGPKFATGAPMKTYEFGDGALAWPMSNVSYDSVNQVPSCPCAVWVRVGRFLATVSVSWGGPIPAATIVSPPALQLAQSVAERARDAIVGS